jgi:hypothetical protein
MHEEEFDPVPLPETQPEMGDGVSAAPADDKPDYEIEDRVIAGNPSLGYTREELRQFLSKHPKYQELCLLKKKLKVEKKPAPDVIATAKRKARMAFEAYIRLRGRRTIIREELEQLDGALYQMMKTVAWNRAALDLRKIQAVLGVQNLKEGQAGKEFRTKLFVQRASPLAAIVDSLAEPLVTPETKLTEESNPTPN